MLSIWVVIFSVFYGLIGDCIGIDFGVGHGYNVDASTNEPVDLQHSLSGFFRNFAEDIRSAPITAAQPQAHPQAALHNTSLHHSVTHRTVDRRLEGRIAFIAGVSDTSGFGWAIAKALHRAGATILVGAWVPMVTRFEKSLENGSLDNDMQYSEHETGTLRKLKIDKVYPIDIAYDNIASVPQAVKDSRRYSSLLTAGRPFAIAEVAEAVRADYGRVDILIHAIANGPEVGKPLLNTSREGYLAAIGSSSYSLISLVHHFMPFMPHNTSSVVSLTYLASEKVIPGYGGGMSTAKAALESDTRTLAYELGSTSGIRINTVSAGPFKSRAANAIRKTGEKRSFIDAAIMYTSANAPLRREFCAADVANAVLFLASRESAAVTGVTLYVDNGMHAMGMAVDSASLTV